MIDCSGLVVIPQNNQYKEIKTPAGYYVDFNVISQAKDQAGETIYHRYRANMWVPEKDIALWREKLVQGTVLKFAGAKWAAEQKEEGKFPMNILKLDSKNIIPLKTPMWIES